MTHDPAPLAPRALIVAHGQPSDPGPAEAELAELSRQISACLPPGWQVGSATLAAPDALARALAAFPNGATGLVYPMFMAEGWFTRRHLPERLAQAGGAGWQVLQPFGCDPDVQALIVAIARQALAQDPRPLAEQALLLAAHGSSRSPAPADVAQRMAALIAAETGIGRVEAAFIDQSPRIAEATGFPAGSVCLPFFAARGGHVIDDLPAALAEAGFQGQLLEPVGCDPRMPARIAQALQRAATLT